jgi:Circadian oscillating protein COP23
MSNWRDRNERDAVPPTVNIHSKNDENKPRDTIKRIDSTILASLVAALASIVAVVVSSVQGNNSSYNSSSIYICERNESGGIETLVVDSNKKKRPFIVWNDGLSLSRCAEIAEKINENKKLGNGKYIIYESTTAVEKLCILKDLNKSCDEENIIYSMDTFNRSNKSQAIYSFDIDNCTIYPSIIIDGSRRLKSSRQFCFSILQE